MATYFTKLVPKENQGRNARNCLICLYGLHETVENLALKGHTIKSIIAITKRSMSPELKEAYTPNKRDILFHTSYCTDIKRTDLGIARKARRDLKKNKATISEINEMVMEHIAKSLSLASNITPEELEKLPAKEKMQFANEATKLLQTEKRIALEAQKTGIEKAKFLNDIGKLASGAMQIDDNESEPELIMAPNEE